MLIHLPTCANTKCEAPVTDLIDCGCNLGKNRWVAIRDAGHQRREGETRHASTQGSEDRPALQGVAVERRRIGPVWHEVVRKVGTVPPGGLAMRHKIDDVVPGTFR